MSRPMTLLLHPKKQPEVWGMTYKTNAGSKAGAALANATGPNKKVRKANKAFNVFERSQKKRKPDLSLFPAGVSNKYRMKDRHTNEKKAARMLKKDEKEKAKIKKE